MCKKSFMAFLFVALLGVCSVEAAVSKNKLMSIAKKQEILSAKLIHAYKTQSLTDTIGTIEKGHAVLQKNTKDPKIKNLIQYLNTCIMDLKKLSTKPYSKENALLVSEISLLLGEGSHYVQNRLK